jgi:hypothetical protein
MPPVYSLLNHEINFIRSSFGGRRIGLNTTVSAAFRSLGRA